MKNWLTVVLSMALALVLPGFASATLPKPAHIVIVMEENQDYSTVTSASNCPYINNTLVAGGALLTNSYGCGHQSEDNYDSLFFGNAENAYADPCPNIVGSVPNLANSLLTGGFTFCGYAETLPSAGSTVCSDSTGNYVMRHCPWVSSLTSVGGNLPVTCEQPFTSFPSSSNYASLPTLSFVIPNLQDDMHTGSVPNGDTWLNTNMSAYATWCKTAANNSLLIVTWDEDATGGSEGDGSTVGNTADNHIATIFYGAMVTTGKYPESAAVNHYNILSTLLTMYSLSAVGDSSGMATISDVFSGAAATATNTPTKTATPALTATSTPTKTATPALTSTPTAVANTPTKTPTALVNTPTKTATAVPPTATETPTETPEPHTPTPTPTKKHKG